MIPLRDINPTSRRPLLVWALVAANVAVFLYQMSLGRLEGQRLVLQWGVQPYYIAEAPHPGSFLTLLTSMFLHGGLMHLVGNMWFLWVFGDNVEDTLGHGRFAAFYVLSGLGAAFAQVLVDPDSRVPMIGASGAIAGVLGGYLVRHPKAHVVALVPLGFFLQTMEVPAFVFILLWFAYQVLLGMLSLGGGGSGGGVAWWAHVGGFIVGALLMLWWGRRDGGIHRTRPRTFRGHRSW